MRLLLVEDEKRMAEALCELLRLEKYDVDHYAAGPEERGENACSDADGAKRSG